ncbi:MAG: 2Fe-2S iron-sulfur cluster binding domain-containing protein [Gammaproteobacteria bacterium]|nr:2Fe-2S iron-sulfur cluster binding domain-containing protein [Gammaproteobacteria bacterium]
MTSEASSADNVTSFRATLDGVEHVVPYQAGEVLLDCMLDADLDPAFQCQQGHCGSCMVLKHRGQLEMRQNNVLSQRDLDQGYVLLCQSIPLSTDVWVDCDD